MNAVYIIIVLFAILCFEIIALFVMTERKLKRLSKLEEANSFADCVIEGIINAPTEIACISEYESLNRFVGEDKVKLYCLYEKLFERIRKCTAHDNSDICSRLNKAVEILNPDKYFADARRGTDIYYLANACRIAGDAKLKDRISDLRTLLKHGDKRVVYSAAMALSEIGDEPGMIDAVICLGNQRKYSHRIVIELMKNFKGDRFAIADYFMRSTDTYLMNCVMKAYADEKFAALVDRYLWALHSSEVNSKVAAVRALGKLDDNSVYAYLIAASKHKNWVIRSEAVKSMRDKCTPEIMAALRNAVSDSNWWVRNNAAQVIVNLHDNQFMREILSGEDNYAADSLRYALEQADTKSEEF